MSHTELKHFHSASAQGGEVKLSEALRLWVAAGEGMEGARDGRVV